MPGVGINRKTQAFLKVYHEYNIIHFWMLAGFALWSLVPSLAWRRLRQATFISYTEFGRLFPGTFGL